MSGALNNIPPVTSPVQPQVPTQAMSDLPASTMPSAAHAPAFDAPPPPAAPPVSSTSEPVMDSGAPYLAGSAAAQAAAAPPIGPLPSYGSDIRPPTPIASTPTMPSSPVTTPSGPSTYSPTSAPVGPLPGRAGLLSPRSFASPPARQPHTRHRPASVSRPSSRLRAAPLPVPHLRKRPPKPVSSGSSTSSPAKNPGCNGSPGNAQTERRC